MIADLENKFNNWTKPPSDTEEAKLLNAERMIREAIKADKCLNSKSIEIFGQGSYANDTNVRLNSDIDICIRLFDTIFYELPEGTTKETFNITDSSYTFSTYKDNVEIALVNYFGEDDVKRGNKAIRIAENTNRIAADVVPAFELRRYLTNGRYYSGTKFFTDKGFEVENWPKQHIENGIAKNTLTHKAFKRTVRILKKLALEMEENGSTLTKKITSFLIECLVWNVPNDTFSYDRWSEIVNQVIIFLYNNTKTDEACGEWVEVSELLYLFRGARAWTRIDVNNFLVEMWNYIGY
jgi:predicted nucleotidyltransferase